MSICGAFSWHHIDSTYILSIPPAQPCKSVLSNSAVTHVMFLALITAERSISCCRQLNNHDYEDKLNKIQSDCQQLGGISGGTEQGKHAPEACLAQDAQLVPNYIKLFAKKKKKNWNTWNFHSSSGLPSRRVATWYKQVCIVALMSIFSALTSRNLQKSLPAFPGSDLHKEPTKKLFLQKQQLLLLLAEYGWIYFCIHIGIYLWHTADLFKPPYQLITDRKWISGARTIFAFLCLPAELPHPERQQALWILPLLPAVAVSWGWWRPSASCDEYSSNAVIVWEY